VSWWPGDTNNNDIAGSNNPQDASGVALVPAEVLDGFSLGTNGYLEVAPSASLANQNFTWAAWVKPIGAGPNNDSTGSTIVQQDIDDYSLSVALYGGPPITGFFLSSATAPPSPSLRQTPSLRASSIIWRQPTTEACSGCS
jgi:hypothetical protein